MIYRRRNRIITDQKPDSFTKPLLDLEGKLINKTTINQKYIWIGELCGVCCSCEAWGDVVLKQRRKLGLYFSENDLNKLPAFTKSLRDTLLSVRICFDQGWRFYALDISKELAAVS